jgi:hypothetical protein
MTLLLLSIWWVGREFIDVVDSICQLSLSFQRRFQGLQNSISCGFDNFMRQPWLYFCNRFDASVMSSLTLSIPYGSCHSELIDDFNVHSDYVFANDLWISRDIAFLTITCVNHDSIFAIYLMCRSWIHWCCWFHTSPVTQYSVMISRSRATLFSLMIYASAVT